MFQEKVQRALPVMKALGRRDVEAVGLEGGVYRDHETTRQYPRALGE